MAIAISAIQDFTSMIPSIQSEICLNPLLHASPKRYDLPSIHQSKSMVLCSRRQPEIRRSVSIYTFDLLDFIIYEFGMTFNFDHF